MAEPILRLKNITKRFPGVIALDNMKLDVYPGEVHALLGENGAGKSTLMKIISGVYAKDEGTIICRGKEVDIKTPLEAKQLGINIIYQEFNLFPQLTVAQNIFAGREPRKTIKGLLDEKKLNKKAQEILDTLSLDISPTEKIEDLSVAKQQMVEIAKAVSFNADILIMDEPTAALTETEIEALFSIIKKFKKQGVGIIYISHRLQELEQIADRVTVFRDGQWVGATLYKATTDAELIRMMVGRDVSDFFHERESHATTEKVLEVKGLTRHGYFEDVNFHLNKGEILGFSGLMGAGRTEVARAIFGADSIDTGQIFLNGTEQNITSPTAAIKSSIGYLSEDRKKDGLALSLSVSDNVVLSSIPQFSTSLSIIQDKKVKTTVQELCDRLRIKTPSLEQKVVNLSGGNQQKIIVAKWLCRQSKIFIFDEPTRGIDIGAKVEIYDLMNELVKEGTSIIMISSELPEILAMSDRIIVMHEGRIKGELPGKGATQEKIMHLATGGARQEALEYE